MALAPRYDYAIMDNAERPRSMVYDVDTGEEVATYSLSIDPKGALAEEMAGHLNLNADA